MDNQAAGNHLSSDQEHYAEAKLQHMPNAEANNQNPIIIHENQNVEVDGDGDGDGDGDNLLCGETDSSDEESTDPEDLPEFVYVDTKELRKILGCALCKGIIRKTKALKNCLHRFCSECIDERLNLGNKQCPICMTTCRSQKATVEDHNFDNIVSICFPKTEEDESKASEDNKENNVGTDHPASEDNTEKNVGTDRQAYEDNTEKNVDTDHLASEDNTEKNVGTYHPDESVQLMDVQYKGKRPLGGDEMSPCKESVPTPSDAPFPSDEMLKRVAKRVATAIIKHRTKAAQQAPPTDSKEE